MEHRVIILRGITGAGKSYNTRHLPQHDAACDVFATYAVFSTDDFWYDPKTRKYRYDPKRIGEAHADCFRRYLNALISRNLEIVYVDNTNISAWEIAPYILAATTYGYDHEIVTIYCDPAVAYHRNVHNVPESVVLSMHARLLTTELPSFWKQRVIFNGA